MDKQQFINQYLQEADILHDNDKETSESRFLETRTREGDITDALRFRVYDPLWMLARQWQLGEFRGNDAGTAMSVCCEVKSAPITRYVLRGGKALSVIADEPVEPYVEGIERTITPLVRVESASYFLDLVYDCREIVNKSQFLDSLRDRPELSLDAEAFSQPGQGSLENPEIAAYTESRNSRLASFRNSFAGKTFDGFKLYRMLRVGKDKEYGCPDSLANAYINWFYDRYKPEDNGSNSWSTRSLGYQFGCENSYGTFSAKDYEGGRLSWYSFDQGERGDGKENVRTELIGTLPVPASYPGAPNMRLWEFEDRKVFLGNSAGMQAKGNVAFLQFATMYNNDWMVCPLKTELGRYIQVEKITVFDSFGVQSVIRRRAEDTDAKTYGQQWHMFENTHVNEHADPDGSAQGLLFPPSLTHVQEGAPVEQVNFLRDEMANMVWGVETRIDDGCGSTMDASLLASEVGAYVTDSYQKEVKKAVHVVRADGDNQAMMMSGRRSDFKYVLMNSVPFNWIPFVPQHLRDEDEKKRYAGFLGGREVVLRRGKMPCFFDRQYWPVRPLTDLLRPEMAPEGEVPLFIDEEQVQGVGTQVVKSCQRARWVGGKTYTWMGYSKELKYTQGNSGLEFDTLKEPTR